MNQNVSVALARADEAQLLSNLLELYIHDLSEVFSVQLGPDARFGYDKLPLYWSEPECRFPFLIRYEGRLAGFALVTRGSPAVPEPEVFDVAEFFILRQRRRQGVGRRAAFLVWDALPGSWTVRAAERNLGAAPFWRRTISEYTADRQLERQWSSETGSWRVFSFDTAHARGGADR